MAKASQTGGRWLLAASLIALAAFALPSPADAKKFCFQCDQDAMNGMDACDAGTGAAFESCSAKVQGRQKSCHRNCKPNPPPKKEKGKTDKLYKKSPSSTPPPTTFRPRPLYTPAPSRTPPPRRR